MTDREAFNQFYADFVEKTGHPPHAYDVWKLVAAPPQPRAPLTEADLPQHPYGGSSPGLVWTISERMVWTISERRAILAWGNALLGIKPAGDGT